VGSAPKLHNEKFHGSSEFFSEAERVHLKKNSVEEELSRIGSSSGDGSVR
jgi:hypothetical protein